MNLKKSILPTLLILGTIAVVTAAIGYTMKPVPLIIQGEVEATQIDLASKIPGRVFELFVENGDKVKKGQVLFTLDSPEIRAKLRQADAAVSAASSMRNKAFTGTRIEQIQGAKNIRDKATAGLELAEKTHARIKNLNDDGIIPAQKLDEAVAQLKVARENVKAANAAYQMARKGARIEDKNASVAMVNKATGARAEVEAYLMETHLVSPINGEIANVIVDPGELAAAGYPVVSIVDLDDVWITFNMREDLLSDIGMGKVIQASFPALGNRVIDLKVNYISPLGKFANWNATKSSGDFDLKTFEVRAIPVLDPAIKSVPQFRPGMSAIVLWEQKDRT